MSGKITWTPRGNIMTEKFKIGGHTIGGGKPCLVIAEVAQAHDGSLGMAHAYIDAASAAGADAVKFQTHIAAAESTPAEPWRIKFSRQDETRFDYWRRMEFTSEQWQGLKQHCDQKKVVFLSSPFSFQAVDLLERLEMAAWKVPSGETGNLPMIERMAATGRPVLLSTGMSASEEIEAAVRLVRAARAPLAVLQCTSAYPSPLAEIGLNLIAWFRKAYGCPAGLSDHSGKIWPGLAAATLGCQIIEVHITFSREMFGPDVTASITTAELRLLVEGIRCIEEMLAHPVDKDALAQNFGQLRRAFTKSIVAAEDLPEGTVLQPQHLALKKPGMGLPPARLAGVIGKRLKRPLRADEFLLEGDIS
jgi:N-acetylneuraminate synthase